MTTENPDALLAALNHPLDATIQRLRIILTSAHPSVREGVKWNAPSYYTTEHFATFHLRSKTSVQVVLHLGVKARPGVDMRARIDDPLGLLDWRGADRATIAFASEDDVRDKRDAFFAILRQWLAVV